MNKEICWNIVKSLLAGALVFLGALSNGDITLKGVFLSLIAALTVAIIQFKQYWEKEEDEYCNKTLGTFL